DYHDLMDLTEELFRTVAQEVLGRTQLTYQGLELDFAQPFARLSVRESIVRFCGDDGAGVSMEDFKDRDAVAALATRMEVPFEKSWGAGRIAMAIFDEKVEHLLLQPTFITEYPTEISPLARCSEENPEVTDRLELFIGGRAIANGFSG